MTDSPFAAPAASAPRHLWAHRPAPHTDKDQIALLEPFERLARLIAFVPHLPRPTRFAMYKASAPGVLSHRTKTHLVQGETSITQQISCSWSRWSGLRGSSCTTLAAAARVAER